jgi:adenosylhomocysteine nucleosidase
MPQMSPTPLNLVCFAVKEEAAWFYPLASGRGDIKTLITGMGRRNAEIAIRKALVEPLPTLVLTCGFAGGLNPELATGTVLFSTEDQSGLASALNGAGAQPGRFHCADRVATSASEKHALREATDADAVEMESAVIRAFCREHQIPSATVRVILDGATDDLPLDFNQLMNTENEIDNRKLALTVSRAPWKIPALLRMRKQASSAARRLAEVLIKATEEQRT